MAQRLPSLNALRTFEAAARHKSFALAAAELSVTPSAVGYQIKHLEDDIGEPLFLRLHRALELTEKGQALAQDLQPAFETITSVWRDLGSHENGDEVWITAPKYVASAFLLTATTAAHAKNAGPKLFWDVTSQKRELGEANWDVAVRYSTQADPRYFCEPILRQWWMPLARPEVARHIKRPRDLLEHGLIDVQFGVDNPNGHTAWPPYLKMLGLPVPNFAMTCIDTPTALEMASETNFVAIGFPIEKHIKSRSLVYPIKRAIVTKSRNWFICPKGRENTDEILWLREAFHTGAEKLRQSVADVEMFELDGTPARTLT